MMQIEVHGSRTYTVSIGAGLLRLSGSRLILTRQGLFVSDLVISDLMQI